MDFQGTSPRPCDSTPVPEHSGAASGAGVPSPAAATPPVPIATPVKQVPAPSPAPSPLAAASPLATGAGGRLQWTPIGEDGEYDYSKQNHYAVLGLGDLGPTASDDQIKKAHRKLLLKLHPDKRGMSVEEATKDPLFLSVQAAHKVLGDDERRKQYDSAFDFDDELPDPADPRDFFDVYGPAFATNARFSVTKPVPLLGTPDDDPDTVDAFYRFWFKFSSWREPDLDDEHDLEDADSREEKRWMKQQNDKARKKWKKEEVKRVQALVKQAFNRDPRIAAAKAAEEAREAEAAAKRAEAAAAAKAAKAAAAEKAARAAEADAVAAAEQKLALRGARTLIKGVWKRCFGVEDAPAGVPRNGAGLLLERVEAQPVISLAVAMASAAGQGFDVADVKAGGVDVPGLSAAQAAAAYALLVAEVQKVKGGVDAVAAAAAAQRSKKDAEAAAAKKAAMTSAPWSAQELSFLAKGIAKYPGGTRNRWQVIADYINSLGLPSKRSKEDCIGKAHALSSDKAAAPASTTVPTPKAAAAASTADSWTPEQQSALEGALRQFPSSMDKKERWRAIAGAVGGKTAKQCALRFKELRAKVKASKGKTG